MAYYKYAVFRYAWRVQPKQKFLSADALKDFAGSDSIPPEQLVQKYGTHFMAGGFVGGLQAFPFVGEYCDLEKAAQLTTTTLRMMKEVSPKLQDLSIPVAKSS